MSSKTFIYILLTLGSVAGGWVPTLWGAGAFSLQGLLGSLVGAVIGIWAGYKAGQAFGA